MPLPIPFYLRTSQTTALTHAQLDGNLSILSAKIDNTTCNNVGGGVGIFESKEIGANDGRINLYSLSGTNGVTVGVTGSTLVIRGDGTDSDWLTNGNDIYNGNTGNVGIGTPIPKTKLELYSTGNTTAINNILRFADNDTVITSFQEQFIGKIEFHSNENSGNGGVKSYVGGIQDSAAGSSIIFATTGGTAGTLEGTNPQDMIGERMRIDPVGNVGIGISAPTEKLHVSGGDTLVETSNGKFYTDLDATGGPGVRLSGNSSDLIFLGVSDVGANGIGIGTRGNTEPSYPGYGKQGDGFIYSSQEQNGLNIISQIGTNKEDYIRFYAGKDANGTTPDIHIQGTGTTKGFVGINTVNPTKPLHISGDTLSEGDIHLPDNRKLQIGDSQDLRIYHDGASSRIAEVGTGNLIISGTEIHLNDSTTGKPFLRTNSALSNVKLYWSGQTRITTSEDGLVLNKTISGTPVANLSIRADGTIITGSTVPVGTNTTVDAQADPNTTGINVVYYTSSSGGGTITIGDSNTLPVGFETKLIRTSTTTAATVGSSGTSTINGSATKALPTAVYSVTTCIANGNTWYCSTGTIL